jgi:hypothetical protein
MYQSLHINGTTDSMLVRQEINVEVIAEKSKCFQAYISVVKGERR